MKKLTKAFMAGAALLAATSMMGCSFVKDLTNSKYEAANTVEDAYPNLKNEVKTEIATEADLQAAVNEASSDMMHSFISAVSSRNPYLKTAKNPEDASAQIKDFYTEFDKQFMPYLQGKTKTVDFDKTIDMAELDFADLIDVALEITNGILGTTYTRSEMESAFDRMFHAKSGTGKELVELAADSIILNKLFLDLDVDINSDASTAKELAYGLAAETTTAVSVKNIEEAVNAALKLFFENVTVYSPVKAVSVYVDSAVAGKVMGDENAKMKSEAQKNKFYLPVVKNFKASYTSSAAVAFCTDSGKGGYISAEVTAKVSQKQMEEMKALYQDYENGSVTKADYEKQMDTYLDAVLKITITSKLKKTHKIGTYTYTEFKTTYVPENAKKIAGMVDSMF